MGADELRDLAVQQFKATTISYPEWQKRVRDGYKGRPYDGTQTSWGRGFAYLDQIGASQEIALTEGAADFGLMLADIADWGKASFSWGEVSEDEVVIRLRRQ